MRKIKKQIIIILCFFILSIFCFGVKVNAYSIDIEEKTYCTATIEDDYVDDSIIITLSNAESLLFKDYTINDFADIDCIAIDDLTEYTTDIVQEQLFAEQSDDWSNLEDRISNNMLVNVDEFHRILCLKLDLNNKQNVLDKIRILEERDEIILAEPDYIESLDLVLDDPYYMSGNQWGLNGLYGINANKAWDITTGDNTVLVGVIDSGIDGQHPDLVNNINEDLQRDYVDTPFLSNVKKIDKEDLEELNGHGTHMAGIIGAQGKNGIGISGVSCNVSLISLRVFDANCSGNTSDVKRAVDFATKEQIPILNPISRLEYDWYSSNESVAVVTDYGTVLGMPVTIDTEVTIYAILKDDPSVVYYRTFTILNDVEESLIEIELEMSYTYSTENGTYTLELNNTNCPFPMIQYYTWNIINESGENVVMNYWGEVTSSGECEVLIIGTYRLNPRVKLYITLIIV